MENNFEILNDSCMDLVAVDTTSATHPSVETNKTVPFCCATNLPTNFNLVQAGSTILYDLDNLFCKIEPICHGSGSQRFNIRVVGSIPFIANATVTPRAGQCSTATTTSGPIKISCTCVVPVNEIVCNVCSYEAAIEACAFLELKLRSCTCVTATVMVDRCRTQGQPNCAVIFTGNFRLPNCNRPTSVTCPGV
ncbi:MAG: hypothetical protein Q4Q02_09485 [Clostridium sp.]|nr:hypothetical protein [Clostridium sp.]